MQKNQNEQKYKYFLSIVKEASDLYVDKYGKNFDNESSCFDISYDNLIMEKLLTETGISCSSENGTKGIIQVSRIAGSDNYKYGYYLTCKDKALNKIIHTSTEAPSGCLGVNGNFYVEPVSAIITDGGVVREYDFSSWVKGTISIKLSSFSPYYYDIARYEYSFDGINYLPINGDTFSISKSYDGKVYFRSVDTNNNYSTVIAIIIRLDNTKPTANINISGTKGNNNWYTSNISASCSGQTDNGGSGIESCTVTPTSISTNTTGQQVKLVIKDKVGNIYETSETVKIDKNSPTIGTINVSGTMGTNGWYRSNVNISNSNCIGGISGCSSTLSVSNISYDTTGTVVTLTVVGGNGKKVVSSKTIKVDKTSPKCNTTVLNNWTPSVTILGSCTDDTSKCLYDNTSVVKGTAGSYSPGTVYDNAGNSTYCSSISITPLNLLSRVVKVGDFVNYNAGTWESSASSPTSHGQFGGYTAGTSKGTSSNCATYGTNYYSSGWRVLSNDGTTIRLISAGTPFCYYHAWKWENYSAYYSSQNIRNYNWNTFKGPQASSSTALTKSIIDNIIGRDTRQTYVSGVWVAGSSYFLADPFNFENRNLIDIHDMYGIGSWSTNSGYGIDTGYVGVGNTYDTSYGLRPIITLNTNLYTTGKNNNGVWSIS